MSIDERFSFITQGDTRYQVLKFDPETGEPYDWDEAATAALVQETEFFQNPPSPPQEPPVPVPAEIQMWQAKTILLRAGLLSQIEQAVKASGNPEIEIAFEYAPNVVRRSSLVTAVATAAGLDDATIDNLFIEGAKIK
ncbi:hypothetical protein [Aquidulcibacter sp.]|uniref:hypothetical protein n=1 Tax=Aquidulcibacter sp. TaxID=2052990 RepID=UPI0025C29B04|nr:hypothetical protein [Aquidulcibacter sp.]MCA3695305.1 hypothetical protein [Aquidulcibacter sp.]